MRSLASAALRVVMAVALVGMASQASATPISLGTPSGLNPGDTFRFLFVTSGTIDATASDIATYNDFVQAQAGGATYDGVTVNWKAIGSTATVEARDNVGGFETSVPVYLPSGVQIATGLGTGSNNLWSTGLLSAPNELIDGTAANTTPWTGTAIVGGGQMPGGQFLGASFVALAQSSNASFWMSAFSQPKAFTYAMFGVSEELTVSATVPEIDPAGMGSVLALVTGALGLFERRRLKMRAV
jgi:hypothetical protein